ncbi:MAG: 3-phosphoshikimate 1-carboxyvinyltransferase [Flammeovirgaceae bacterium]|nr:3-phosphoshikimate 1-carboxyvinyltransferase [Flammeovirgaceae bacterium]MBE63787.1 3-phosphoshikimate 1-carboxyvinyltransferase [Flammeovirgaceae bacterium]
MLKYLLKKFDQPLKGRVQLTSSKSESNRALLINALSGNKLSLDNLSAARDTQTMTRLLQELGQTWDVLDAGTTMRFSTAYLGVKGQGEIITGTERMCQRPIGLLVDALRKLGATVEYQKVEGYPPLKIWGIKEQKTNRIDIPGNISSQFISALLMIGPSLPNGIEINLTTEIFSRPYIEMTLGLMKRFGVTAEWEGQLIKIASQEYTGGAYTIESDWSGASYWYSMAALNADSDIILGGLREDSLQGDQEIATIMEKLGVSTTYIDGGAHLKTTDRVEKEIHIDFKTCPDLAQTVLVVAAIKGATLKMTGLESLRIKETDRIAAMQNELAKMGATLTEEGSSWTLTPGMLPEQIEMIDTYDDHRMAMAFGPVCQVQEVLIDDPSVVNKSYPAYWDDLKSVGTVIEEV